MYASTGFLLGLLTAIIAIVAFWFLGRFSMTVRRTYKRIILPDETPQNVSTT